jgi:FkbM family methyltransferase
LVNWWIELVNSVRHAGAALRNAFLSTGARRFGWRFSRDYLRIAFAAARAWGSAAPGEFRILGFRVPYPNRSHALFLVHEIFVNGAYAFTPGSMSPRIVDCGANVGMAILFFKACWPEATIVAIEPDPVAFSYLQRLVEINNLRDVQLVNCAAAGEDGVALLYRDVRDEGGITSSLNASCGGADTQEVRVIRLSSLIDAPVDFLKLDIEGAEYGVIEDLARAEALKHIREAAIECHELSDDRGARQRLLAQLEASGMHVSLEETGERMSLMRATRTVIG